MTTIYVVTAGSYSDYHIEGIFSTFELAQVYCNGTDGDDGETTIDEWELDATNQAERWAAVYHCQIDLETGNVIHAYSNFDKMEINWRGVNSIELHGLSTYGSSIESPDHALKLAAEARQEWQRRKMYPNESSLEKAYLSLAQTNIPFSREVLEKAAIGAAIDASAWLTTYGIDAVSAKINRFYDAAGLKRVNISQAEADRRCLAVPDIVALWLEILNWKEGLRVTKT